ncbi:MAG TPA: hypothetical protein EYO61_05795 [Campylobacterales bacterium]|nr:hypothetical protein [Campylobacterales bacterium]HIO71045.1 hypothetical protein [Campylobacterales bacterium]
MSIRQYFFASIALFVAIGWATFAFVTQTYTGNIELFEGYYIPDMPVAVAVLIPAIVLFVFTLLHMIFYKLIYFIKHHNQTQDLKKLEDAIFMNLKGKIGEGYKPHYTTNLYKDIGELINVSKIDLVASAEVSKYNKFYDIVKTLVAIKNGEVVEVDSSLGYKIKELNYWNSLKQDPNIAETILMEKGFYSDELYIEAFNTLCLVNTYSTIKRYDKWLNVQGIFNILSRIDAEENGLSLTKEEIFELLDSISFSRDRYLELAKVLKNSHIIPDFRIEIFKHLLNRDDEAVEGYLYTLLNLEMVDEAEKILEEISPEALPNIRAYIFLKKNQPSLLDLDYFFR